MKSQCFHRLKERSLREGEAVSAFIQPAGQRLFPESLIRIICNILGILQ